MINLIKEYFDKRIELIKLNLTEKASTAVGTSIPYIILGVLLIFFLFLLNVGLGLLIGDALQNYAFGFLILAGFYLLMMLLIYLFRNSIKKMIVDKAINNFYNK